MSCAPYELLGKPVLLGERRALQEMLAAALVDQCALLKEVHQCRLFGHRRQARLVMHQHGAAQIARLARRKLTDIGEPRMPDIFADQLEHCLFEQFVLLVRRHFGRGPFARDAHGFCHEFFLRTRFDGLGCGGL